MSWKNRRSSKAEALALEDDETFSTDPADGGLDDGNGAMAAVHVLHPAPLPPPGTPAPAEAGTVSSLPAPPPPVTADASTDAVAPAPAPPAPRLLSLAPPVPVAPPPLPVLVEGIAGSLGVLRAELGVAYPTTVWLDQVLPGIGVSCSQPVVLRDLLGICALEAGGVRTDPDAVLGDGEGETGRVAYELHLALAGLIARARVLPLEDVLPPVVPLG